MLEITIPERELAVERADGVEFVTVKETKLQLEHSLISLSKWESKWKKPFLTEEPHEREEMLDYIRCMTITQHVDPQVYEYIPFEIYQQIEDYISTEQTATKIFDRRQHRGGHEIITSELIYYWMIYHNIPSEYQKWHLSRLLTLIRICSIKGSNQMMDQNAIYRENDRLNAMRRAARKK